MTNKDPIFPLPKGLIAKDLADDPRISRAKQLLQEALSDHKNKIYEVRPPQENLKQSYEKTLQDFASLRGGNLWYRYLGSGIGNGSLVELLDGSIKYDFISGIGPHIFGHSHPLVVDANIDAAIADTTMQGHLQQNYESLSYSKLLLEQSGLDRCFFCSTGVMAVENGLKIAFQKKQTASRILAFENCFTGRTLVAAQITDKASFRKGLPPTIPVDYIPFFDHNDPEGSTKRAAQTLKKHIERYPDQHVAMIFELVQGEGGFNIGNKEFFETLMTICQESGIFVLADEVQTFGRVPSLFAFKEFGLEPLVDIVALGKVSQACATLYKEKLTPQPGLLGQTFTSSVSALRSGYAIVHSLVNDGFLGPNGKIATTHNYFVQNLENLHKTSPELLQGPWGIGSMISFTPLDGDTKKATKLAHQLFDEGLITFIAGSNPCRVRMLLPIGSITFEDIDAAVAILEKSLRSCTD